MGTYSMFESIFKVLQIGLALGLGYFVLLYVAYKRPESFIGGLLFTRLPKTLQGRSVTRAGMTSKKALLQDVVPGQMITYLNDYFQVTMRGEGTQLVFFKKGQWQETAVKYFIASLQWQTGQGMLIYLPKKNLGAPVPFLFRLASMPEALGVLKDEGPDAPITQFLTVEEKNGTIKTSLPGLGKVTILDGVHMNIRPTVAYDPDDGFGMRSTPEDPEHVYTVLIDMSGGYGLFVSYETGPRQWSTEIYIGDQIDINGNTFEVLPPANADTNTLKGI